MALSGGIICLLISENEMLAVADAPSDDCVIVVEGKDIVGTPLAICGPLDDIDVGVS